MKIDSFLYNGRRFIDICDLIDACAAVAQSKDPDIPDDHRYNCRVCAFILTSVWNSIIEQQTIHDLDLKSKIPDDVSQKLQ